MALSGAKRLVGYLKPGPESGVVSVLAVQKYIAEALTAVKVLKNVRRVVKVVFRTTDELGVKKV